ncbi:hypothetical protein [Thalassospira australica]|uniref:hypothetical protein n=1 Tax=Thalassospira australica TaxID=1528106 RepID=UPI00384D10FD
MKKLQAEIINSRLVTGQYGDIRFGPWGFEYSDRHSFVSLTDQCRNARQTGDHWQLAEGEWALDYHTLQTDQNRLHIRAALTARCDGLLQDAVIRLVFDKSNIQTGEIAGRQYRHTDSDRYRLYPVRTAHLTGTGDTIISVTLDRYDGAGRFAPYLYLRDSCDHWIIHARLLPIDPVDHVWLRWANRLFTLSTPDWLARMIWNCPGGRAIFWRLRERLGRHCPEIQAVPLNNLKSGQSLLLEVTCRFR